jgi:hypothetical protein
MPDKNKRRADVITLSDRRGAIPDNWPEPEKILRTALVQARLQAMLRRMCVAWPSIHGIAESLAEYLTELIPDPDQEGRTLLGRCLTKGMRVGEDAMVKYGATQDPRVYEAVLVGIVSDVHLLGEWIVRDEPGCEWDLFRDGPLHHWRVGRSGVRVARRDEPRFTSGSVADRSIRMAVATRMLSTQDVDILDGRLDVLLDEVSGLRV